MKILLLSVFVLLFGAACSSTGNSPIRYTNEVIRSPDRVDVRYLTTGLDQLPVIKRGKVPSHPDSERWSRGYARVSFTINEKGRTENIQIVDSTGKSFGGNTAYAVRFWHFEPAMKDGVPAPCEAIYEIRFRGHHFGGINE